MLTHNTTNQGEQPASATIGDLLATDHRRMEALFQEIVSQSAAGEGDRLRQSWTAFERALLAHIESEETFLIKSFATDHPLDAARIISEHQSIRRKLTEMGVDLDLHCLPADRVGAFIDELRRHARNEEAVLYQWAAAQLDPWAAAGVGRVLQAVRSTGSPAASVEQWCIDPARSTLSFAFRHLVLLEIKGHFARWGGTVWFDRNDPARSKVEAWIDLGSVDTGDAERDRHLCSAELLNIGRFPRAIYASHSVTGFDGRAAVIHGDLSLHGIQLPVDLKVQLATEGEWAARGHLSCSVTGAIDRQRFGLHWNQDLDIGGLVVGDTITITAHVEAADP